MSDALTFDLIEFFSGDNYPENTVTVFMNQKIAYERAKLSDAAAQAVASKEDEEAAKITAKLEAISAEAEKSKFVFHLKAVPSEVRKAIENANIAKYHRKRDVFNRLEANAEAEDALELAFWRATIQKVVTPTGAEMNPPTEEEIKVFLEKSPEPARKDIVAAIRELDDTAAAGHESLVGDQAFLSTP